MRFRHLDPAPVLAFLRGSAADIRIRDWDRERTPGGIAGFLRIARSEPANPAQPGTISDVEFIAGRGMGPSHAGTVLRFYFHINSSADERILPLVEAVAHVEGRGTGDEFLLAGHPDGGLISVSRQRLPFQQGSPIIWWGP
ncbi:MAG: hypothetical protein KIT69_15180 [Propionibacteriaceae bacterium]|nr:hypothetical protein [Propionibacteriaceae bacterium]